MERRVTIRDIAKKAGVHFTTVSMALRNHPRLPRETRERIQKMARAMGYRPDAMLAALSSYRVGLIKRRHQATLGWVNCHPDPQELYEVGLYHDYLLGARVRAEQLGYTLEEIWLREPGLTRARVSTILRTRGIQGVIVAPLPRGTDTIDLLPWNRLSALSLGFSLKKPELHTVVPMQYHGMRTILRELRALGYRRIGLVCEPEFDRRCDGNWQAAFWVDYHSQPEDCRVEPLWHPAGGLTEAVFVSWFHRYKPDVIVSARSWISQIPTFLKQMKLSVPKDVGLAYHHVRMGDTESSGIDENGRKIGAAALDYLVAMLNRQEFGVPDTPQHLLVEGRWVPGRTVRRQRATEGGRPRKARALA